MPFKRNKEEPGSSDMPSWMMESGLQATENHRKLMPVGNHMDYVLSTSNNSGLSSNSHPMSFPLQPASKGMPLPIQTKASLEGPPLWPEGGMAPMWLKRNKKDKKNKKNKMKDKHKDVVTLGNGSVSHVGKKAGMLGPLLPTEQLMSNHILGPGKHTVGENWILGLKPPMPFPSSPQDIVLPRPTMPSLPPHPPLSQPPPSPLSLPPPSQLPEAQQSYNPALHGRGYPHTPADLQHVMPSQAEGPSDKPSIAVGLSKMQQHDPRVRCGGGGGTSSFSGVDAKASKNNTEIEIKRTMKTSKIQRDVDIINHVLDDLEEFMKTLKDKAAAWVELEKMGKKSRRKTHDAVLETLKKRANPPTEHEFVTTYQKCKFGINLISKLGHHLSSPTPQQLLKGLFVYIQEMVNMNKGTQLASNVKTPLFTKAAYDLMKYKLLPKHLELWEGLGANWLITIDQWKSPPPEYEPVFSDGCVPTTLHNSSDCPSNFPTLDTLPREWRTPDYSEAYDGSITDGKTTGGLMISPAVMYLMGATPKTTHAVQVDTAPGQPVLTRTQPNFHSSSSQDSDSKKAKVLFNYEFGVSISSIEASAPSEISVHRGEIVDVLDESGVVWCQVKNKMGSSGNVPVHVVETITKKSKDRSDKPVNVANMINLHGRSVPAPPKSTPPPIPGTSSGMTHKASPQPHSHGRRVSQFPQNLFTVPENSESMASAISYSKPTQPPLGSPPQFPPVLPHQQQQFFGSTALPSIPISQGILSRGAPPIPPPLPPVAAPKALVNISEVIQQNKMKCAGKPKKDNKEFDIAEALSRRKPLRKTANNLSLAKGGKVDSSLSSELQAKLLVRKSSAKDTVGDGYQVLSWKATITEIKKWLIAQGYGSTVEKMTCKKGEHLYAKTRDQLRDMLGNSDGVRLYSQLQADKKTAQKEGGAEKISKFQKLMQARRTAADEPAGNDEPDLGKGRYESPTHPDPSKDKEKLVQTHRTTCDEATGNETAMVKGQSGRHTQPDSNQDKKEVPIWKLKLKTRLAEKGTLFDDNILHPPGKVMYQDVIQHQEKFGKLMQNKRNSQNHFDVEKIPWNESERRGERYSDEEWEGRRNWKQSNCHHLVDSHYSDGERDHRRGQYHHDDRDYRIERYSDEEDRRGRRWWKGSHNGHGRNRRSSTYSDEEDYKNQYRRRSRKRDDSCSDFDSEYERKMNKKNMDNKKNKKNKKKKHNIKISKKKKRGPTNIDEYDSSYTLDSNSDFDTASNSDSRKSEHDKKKPPDSAKAGADPSDVENMNECIKFQQSKIKQELNSLSQLQKESRSKTLTLQQQMIFQKDLLKLEQLQTMLSEDKGNMSLQTQLLSQQMLLFEHLTEAKEAIRVPIEVKSPTPKKSTTPTDTLSSPPDTLQLQMLQQQALTAEHQRKVMAVEQQLQAVAAEQQLQSMVNHQMQAEQQRQMISEEQQRQLLMAQMAGMSSPSFMSPQPTAFEVSPQATTFGIIPQQAAFGIIPNATTFGMNPISPALYSPYGNSMGYY